MGQVGLSRKVGKLGGPGWQGGQGRQGGPLLGAPGAAGAAGFGDARRVDLRNDSAIRAMAALFARTPVETLRAYTAFHYLDNQAPLLSDDWVDAHFDLYSRRLAGKLLDFERELSAPPGGE